LASGGLGIIGVRRRVSRGGVCGNADGLCRSVGRLWRSWGRAVFRGEMGENGRRGCGNLLFHVERLMGNA